MSQDARTRAVIDEAVERALAPLAARLEALERRVAADQSAGGDKAAPEAEKPQAGRRATPRAASGKAAAVGPDEVGNTGR